MKNNELPRENLQTFHLVLDKEWQQGDFEYVAGFDPCKEENEPVNFYHKLRKFLGMKFKNKESKSYCSVYKKYSNGRIEHIK